MDSLAEHIQNLATRYAKQSGTLQVRLEMALRTFTAIEAEAGRRLAYGLDFTTRLSLEDIRRMSIREIQSIADVLARIENEDAATREANEGKANGAPVPQGVQQPKE